ncbi:MAG TPA: hypothetical protein VMA77_10280 [Solirubrobacteraceae bacterium]|nr:hypothetical protein [Solirubrobacteraceae bacterium]
MPWWAWASIAVYAGVWRVTFRVLWEEEPTTDWAIFWQCVCGAAFLFWLVGLILFFEKSSSRLTPDRVARVIGGESRAHKRRRREQELRDLEARVQLAETELGIDGDDPQLLDSEGS